MEELEFMKNKILSGLLLVAMIASMFSFMSIGVSAKSIVDWADDPVGSITSLSINEFDETLMADGVSQLMYALLGKKNSDADIAKAKWFPIIGDLDISKYIPKKAGDKYLIVIRGINDIASDGKVTKPVKVELNGRRDVKTLLPKTVLPVWKPATGTNVDGIYNATTTDVEIKLGIGTWMILGEDPLEIAPEAFPAGVAGSVRLPAQEENGVFATAEVKFTIKAQPKAPKIPTTAPIKGLKTNMEISVDDGATWKPLNDKAVAKTATTTDLVLDAVELSKGTAPVYVRIAAPIKNGQYVGLPSVKVQLP